MPDFLKYFETETEAESDLMVAEEGYTCPPSTPATTRVSSDSVLNYDSVKANAANGYGLTGLMSMVDWTSDCYKSVTAGSVFLFPGIAESDPPAYTGTCSLNCATQEPLTIDGGTLHGQMCALLGRPTTDFIGFSVSFSADTGKLTMGYNSGTCNGYWFGGSRTIPTDCNGVDWQKIVSDAVTTKLAKNLSWIDKEEKTLNSGTIEEEYVLTDINEAIVGLGFGIHHSNLKRMKVWIRNVNTGGVRTHDQGDMSVNIQWQCAITADHYVLTGLGLNAGKNEMYPGYLYGQKVDYASSSSGYLAHMVGRFQNASVDKEETPYRPSVSNTKIIVGLGVGVRKGDIAALKLYLATLVDPL
jgi:hypothetical protein